MQLLLSRGVGALLVFLHNFKHIQRLLPREKEIFHVFFTWNKNGYEASFTPKKCQKMIKHTFVYISSVQRFCDMDFPSDN